MACSRTWTAKSADKPVRRLKAKRTKVILSEQLKVKDFDYEIYQLKKTGWQYYDDQETDQ